MYDDDNVFAKILRGEIPAKKVYEDETALAFYDVAPKAPVHVLVIPKAKYTCFSDFVAGVDASEVGDFMRAVEKAAKAVNLTDYRLIFNNGKGSGQEVPHLHAHILGGAVLPF